MKKRIRFDRCALACLGGAVAILCLIGICAGAKAQGEEKGTVIDGFTYEEVAVFRDGHTSPPSRQWVVAVNDGGDKVFVYVNADEYGYLLNGTEFDYSRHEIMSIQRGVCNE